MISTVRPAIGGGTSAYLLCKKSVQKWHMGVATPAADGSEVAHSRSAPFLADARSSLLAL